MCILPEILGRWYTRTCISNSGTDPEACIQPDPELSTEPNPSSESVLESSTPLESQYCYCQEPERDGVEMIACDHPKLNGFTLSRLEGTRTPGEDTHSW